MQQKSKSLPGMEVLGSGGVKVLKELKCISGDNNAFLESVYIILPHFRFIMCSYAIKFSFPHCWP